MGALLIQIAWALVLPPFRGTDEFDHAYRAAEVASGEWRAPRVPARHGRGDLITVPASLVEAAQPICSSYEYTGPDNCFGAGPAGHRKVLVGSGAAAYNPVFYFLVGTPARPFDGYQALYVMRAATILLNALWIAFAGWVLACWARTRWPSAALVLGLTPVTTFSISIVSPNGVEMMAAVSLWTALLGLCTERGRGHAARLLVAASVSAAALTMLRSIGPLWVVLVSLTCVAAIGVRQGWAIVRQHVRLSSAGLALVVAATLAAVAWTRSTDAARLVPYDMGIGNPVVASLGQLPLWLFQGVAAFPRRGDAAPPAVYVLAGTTALALIAVGFLRASGRLRRALVFSAATATLVPLFLTILTIKTTGAIWQGRYGIPYHVGLFLLAGLALDLRAVEPVRTRSWALLGIAMAGLAHVVALTSVLRHELRTSPLRSTGTWLEPPWWAVTLLLVSGFVCWGFMLVTRPGAQAPAREESGARSVSDSVTA